MQDIDWKGFIETHREEIDGLRAPDPRHQSKDLPAGKPKMTKKRYTDKQLERFRQQPWNSLDSSQKHAVTAYETRMNLPYTNPKRQEKDGRPMPDTTPTQIKRADKLVEQALAAATEQPTPAATAPAADETEEARRLLIKTRLATGIQRFLAAATTALDAGDTSQAKAIIETALAAISIAD